MAIHLIPFVAGAVIGGLGAYFYRDEKLRREVRRTTAELGGRARKTADQVSGKVSDTVSRGLGGVRAKRGSRKPGQAPGESLAQPASQPTSPPARKKPVRKKKTAAKKKMSAQAPAKD